MPAIWWTMDEPATVKLVDKVLTQIKTRSDVDKGSTVAWLSGRVKLSRTEVRGLLRLARRSRRAAVLWPGHRLDCDAHYGGYRVVDHVDEWHFRKGVGDMRTALSTLVMGPGSWDDAAQAPSALRLCAELSRARVAELEAMIAFAEENMPVAV